jgi:phage terminase large subunit
MGVLQGEIDLWGVLDNLGQMPHQKRFISAPERNVAYVGGRGSGKTAILCASAILNAANEANGYSLIGRRHMPELESTTMKTFLEMVPADYGEWQDTKKIFKFFNGHDVIFKHLDITDPKIVGHIKSMNLSAAYVDEGTETAEEVYFLLLGALRRKTALRHIIRIASNPAGHDWVWSSII